MISGKLGRFLGWGVAVGALSGVALAQNHGQDKEVHGRKYKPLVPAARITIVVEKAANGKPVENAGVVFRAITKEGHDEGGLEIKTDPDGHAMLDVIEVGSHVKVQVIAEGYSTAAVEFDVPTDEKRVVVKMEKPRAQISSYQDNAGKPLQRPVGVQEPPPVLKTTKKPSGLMSVPPPVGPATSPETAAPAAMTPSGAATPPAETRTKTAPAEAAPKMPPSSTPQ